MNDLSTIAQLASTSDAQAARMVAESTHEDLIDRITATAYQPSGRDRASRGAGRPPVITRRRLAVGLPAAAAVAVATLVITSAGHPGQHVGPINVGPAKAAAALTFTRHGRYIEVIVRDPLADEKKYNAEFKAHGLHIRLGLVAASPSLVGTLVYSDGGSAITPITAIGRCWTGGGGSQCPVGLRVPIDYHGTANLVFGRAARPGERYETTAPATVRGEVLYGLRVAGHRVRAVLSMLAARHVTVGEYNFQKPGKGGVLGRQVPRNWFVYEADPWAPGQVMLFVGQTRQQKFYAGPPSKLPAPKVTRAPGS